MRNPRRRRRGFFLGRIARMRPLDRVRSGLDGLRISAQIGLCDAKSGAVPQIIFDSIWRLSRAIAEEACARHVRSGKPRPIRCREKKR
jgi:hypothetical protein